MFDFDAGKLIIVGIIALIFIPPKDLPRVLRQVGQLVGKMRRMAGEFQGQFMDAMREADIADLRKEAQKLADGAKAQMGLGDVDAHNRSIMQAIERKDVPKPPPEPEPAAAHETVEHPVQDHPVQDHPVHDTNGQDEAGVERKPEPASVPHSA